MLGKKETETKVRVHEIIRINISSLPVLDQYVVLIWYMP